MYLIDLNPKFKLVTKDRLFYDQFEYCLNFFLQEVSCLRELDHDAIDYNISRRKMWREVARQRWQNNPHAKNIMGYRRDEITDQTVQELHELAEVLLKSGKQFKLVVSINTAWVYCNDFDFLQELSELDTLKFCAFSRAVITRPKDTVKLKKSCYKFRTYLKYEKLNSQERYHLEEFLINQHDSVRLSPGLIEWMDRSFNVVQDYYFVDHNETSWLTMLNLVRPGLIRKTMHIITDK